MANDSLMALASQLCKIESQLKEIENSTYGELKTLSKTVREALVVELKDRGLTSVERPEGTVSLVARNGGVTVDLVKLKEEVGEEVVKKFEQKGKDSEYIKVSLTK